MAAIRGQQDPARIVVTDFGAAPDSRANAVAAVQRALEAARRVERPTLVFPKGRYDFWPQHAVERTYFESNTTDNNPKRLAILIEGFKGLTVDGGGSTFVFHDRMQPFTVDRSTGVTIRRRVDRLGHPADRGSRRSTAATDEYIDLRDRRPRSSRSSSSRGGWCSSARGGRARGASAMEFDGQTLQRGAGHRRYRRVGPGWRDYRAEMLDAGTGAAAPSGSAAAGARATSWCSATATRDHAGLFVVDSRDVTVENVNLYHAAGLGLLAQFTENLTVRRFNAVPSPARRVVSGHDDGVQVSNCRGLVLVERSTVPRPDGRPDQRARHERADHRRARADAARVPVHAQPVDGDGLGARGRQGRLHRAPVDAHRRRGRA